MLSWMLFISYKVRETQAKSEDESDYYDYNVYSRSAHDDYQPHKGAE